MDTLVYYMGGSCKLHKDDTWGILRDYGGGGPIGSPKQSWNNQQQHKKLRLQIKTHNKIYKMNEVKNQTQSDHMQIGRVMT